MAKSTCKLKITGIFHCKVFKDGKLIQEITDKNMVVQGGLDYIAELIAGDTILHPLTKIGVGTDPTAPTLGDTNLTTPFFRDFNSATSGVGSVVIDWQIDPSEANGITIQEFGLGFSDLTLFARKTGVSIAKDNTVSMVGTWTINIASS